MEDVGDADSDFEMDQRSLFAVLVFYCIYRLNSRVSESQYGESSQCDNALGNDGSRRLLGFERVETADSRQTRQGFEICKK